MASEVLNNSKTDRAPFLRYCLQDGQDGQGDAWRGASLTDTRDTGALRTGRMASVAIFSFVLVLWELMLSPGASAQDAESGSAIFESACAHCHGSNGQGGQLGPSILRRVLEEEEADLIAFLRKGSPERGMPPTVVMTAQLPDLIIYLRFLASSAGPSELTVTGGNTINTANREVTDFEPVTDASLLNPDPADWLWFSRTPDAQRFSPLEQITSINVNTLGLAWARALPNGLSYTIPLVHDGTMYLTTPAGTVVALDATNGDQIWEYQRTYANPSVGKQDRSKTLSLYDDMVYFTAPDSTIVALDARNGTLRWEASAGGRGHSAGSIVVKGKVISAGNCIFGPRDNCFISAHDAHSGELLWRFNTVQAASTTTGEDSWAGVPLENRLASPWGLPGSYDPKADLIYWGIANPMPTTRTDRHDGNPDAVGYAAPVELYSNSTVALDPDSGELAWYYQHLPGDDWDLDMNQDRTLLTTKINPDPAHVRWINPNIEMDSSRDVIVNVGEGGGLWVLDRHSGEFLWATPFPFDVDNFFLSDIDVDTGITHINRELLVDEPGERHLICYFNTRSFWPTAYMPDSNSLYVPYIRNCLDMTSASPDAGIPESRVGAPEPGVALDELNGLARVNLETGEITHWPMGRIPTNSAMLATAGKLIFWGDIDRHYRAMDAQTGAVLWETTLGGPISMSNITYAVGGRQYVAVIAGETLSQQVLTRGGMGPIPLDLDEPTGQATLYVFALPLATDN